jgi:transporter family-2 protein
MRIATDHHRPTHGTARARPGARATGTIGPVATVLLAGTLLPAQLATNTALAGALGSTTLAAATSYVVGGATLGAAFALQRGRTNWGAAREAPWWAWVGGVTGSVYVVGSLLLTRALGAATATTLVVASQVTTAIALEHFGALGLPRHRVNAARATALILTVAALVARLPEAS